jgi:multiple sugar transport system permease protein
MSLVGKVGRKRPRARIAMAFVYLILSIGALTTLYPFATMLTTGFKGTTDQNDNKLIPSFWSDQHELEAKYLDDKYAGNASWMNNAKYTNPADQATIVEYEKFLNQLPPDQWIAGFTTPSTNVTSRLNYEWQQWLKTKYKSVEEVNTAFTEFNGAFQQITPPAERLDDPTWNPKDDQKWADWLAFKKQLPAEFRIPISANRLYQEFLRTKFKNQLADVPKSVKFEELKGKDTPDFSQARITNQNLPIEKEFYEIALPKPFIENGTIENQWRNWVASSGDPSVKATETLPQASFDSYFLAKNAASIKHNFTWRNYGYVLDYILINGRAVVNTIIFCLLTILIQLTVNPIAAYALSRYPMKATGKILLFLLATMAFPAEVAMIPSFLLLKDLHLLNTFAALVLPAAASGYMIFLLKGFFDSLPQEIFESGQIDGAPEWKMMLKLAFPLSKPVFGYLALIAFMGSYGAFIYAFLVAQNREMWTLMVFIYQLQLSAPKSVVMAAVTLAALPTLLVFLLAQNVIMRGIVLPGER